LDAYSQHEKDTALVPESPSMTISFGVFNAHFGSRRCLMLARQLKREQALLDETWVDTRANEAVLTHIFAGTRDAAWTIMRDTTPHPCRQSTDVKADWQLWARQQLGPDVGVKEFYERAYLSDAGDPANAGVKEEWRLRPNYPGHTPAPTAIGSPHTEEALDSLLWLSIANKQVNAYNSSKDSATVIHTKALREEPGECASKGRSDSQQSPNAERPNVHRKRSKPTKATGGMVGSSIRRI